MSVWKRRTLLKAAAGALPTLKLLAQNPKTSGRAVTPSAKFTPVDLSLYFNASAADFGKRLVLPPVRQAD